MTPDQNYFYVKDLIHQCGINLIIGLLCGFSLGITLTMYVMKRKTAK